MQKIKKDSFDRIVFYGCSWTEGQEIIDHEVFDMTFEKCNEWKKQFKSYVEWNNSYHGKHIVKDIVKQNINLYHRASWGGQLASKLNKNFENRSKGGTGIDEHLFRIIKDYHNGNITNNDLVILGLTKPDRTFVFDETGNIKTKLFLEWHWPTRDIRNWCVENIFNDSYMIWNYNKTLLALNDLPINLKFQPVVHGINPKHKAYSIDQISFYVNDVWKKLEDKFLLEDCYLDKTKEMSHCGFGHLPKESHDDLANKIFENCFYD
jgi:hypothetical protein